MAPSGRELRAGLAINEGSTRSRLQAMAAGSGALSAELRAAIIRIGRRQQQQEAKMTGLHFRRPPVASDAALRKTSPERRINPSIRRVLLSKVSLLLKLCSLRSISVLKTSVNPAVVKWPDMAVRKASELSAESLVLILLANTSACSSGLLSSLPGENSGSELTNVSCSVTRRSDESESTAVISDMHFDSCFR